MSIQQMFFASLAAGGGYVINGSGLWPSTGTNQLKIVHAGASPNKRIFTVESVFKRNDGAVQSSLWCADDGISTYGTYCTLKADGKISIEFDGTSDAHLITTQVVRDPAAWYNLVVAIDTTQGTAANRCRIYLNGTEVTSFSTETNPSLNYDTQWGTSGGEFYIGNRDSGSGTDPFEGYIARTTIIDNQQLTPTSFGELTDDGFWSISDVSGLTFNTNGALIEGGSAMSAGTDSSGNDNDFTKSGTITATNDSPTNDSANDYGNYAVWDVLQPASRVGTGTYTNGNLSVATGSSPDFAVANLQIPTTGKWYFECELTANSASTRNIGLCDASGSPDGTSQSRIIRGDNGQKYSSAGGGWTSYGVSFTVGNHVGVAVDMDNGAVYFSKDGTYMDSGDPTSGSSKTGAAHTDLLTASIDTAWFLSVYLSSSAAWTANFGATTLNTAAPTGYSTLSTASLPTPSVINYEDEYYIQAGISHSNGSTTAVTLPKTVSGGAMVRIKETDAAVGWYVFDTVRGANKFFFWNTNAAEDTSTFDDQNLTGTTFTIPSDMASGTYLLECFFVSSYFKIIEYAGNGGSGTRTYAHGASEELGFAVTMRVSAGAAGHAAAHKDLTSANWFLDSTTNAAQADYGSVFFDISDGTNITIDKSSSYLNTNGADYVTYAWANSGPYAFGSYEGNNAADGPMLNFGGSAASVMAKDIDNTGSWPLFSRDLDIAGSSPNPSYTQIYQESTAAANVATVTLGDYLSNGWKFRFAGGHPNGASTHIYGAFGIQPLTDGAVNQGRAR